MTPGPLTVHPQALAISLCSSLGAEMRKEARDGGELGRPQLGRRLDLREISSRISCEEGELGACLSFAGDVEMV